MELDTALETALDTTLDMPKYKARPPGHTDLQVPTAVTVWLYCTL